MPIRISIIKPTPFCPSLEPWKKLTAVQVKIRIKRIQRGGGLRLCGSLKMVLFFTNRFRINISITVSVKPKNGETMSDIPVLPASLQLTAAPPPSGKAENAIPTPKIAPIKVCELEEGSP